MCCSGKPLTSVRACMCRAPEPTHSETGELEDGGADLNMGGLCTYYHDLIYLSAFVQLAAIFTDRAWLSYGVVRARALCYSKYLDALCPCQAACRVKASASGP